MMDCGTPVLESAERDEVFDGAACSFESGRGNAPVAVRRFRRLSRVSYGGLHGRPHEDLWTRSYLDAWCIAEADFAGEPRYRDIEEPGLPGPEVTRVLWIAGPERLALVSLGASAKGDSGGFRQRL